MALTIKAKESCRWDLVSLGEVMLRFDPGDRRIWTTRTFEVSEGGGEYNVARGLKRCFGLDTAIVTACHSGQGGTGDVAILTAGNRMALMPFAQIATRIGGALTVTIVLIVLTQIG